MDVDLNILEKTLTPRLWSYSNLIVIFIGLAISIYLNVIGNHVTNQNLLWIDSFLNMQITFKNILNITISDTCFLGNVMTKIWVLIFHGETHE